MNLKKRFFLFLMIVFVALGVVSCSNASNSVTVNFGSDSYKLKEGASIQLDVNIKDNDEHSAASIRSQLVYSVKDTTVAVVDANGNLTGVGAGETEVKVEWSEKAIVFDLAKVTVLLAGIPEVEVAGFNPNMLKGAKQTISYSFVPAIRYSFVTVLTDATVSFESANPDVATVDANGQITAVKVGEATIIMYVKSGDQTGSKVLKVNVSESDFAINYNLDGGNNAEANPAGYNTLETPVAFVAPTKTGYDFGGWFADAEFQTPYAEIPAGHTGDVSVYAKFDVHNYAISYDLDGGANGANPATYTVNDEIILADATKDNYKFLGWFNAADEKVTKIAKGSTGDVALKAKWEVNAFAINYNLDGGHFILPYIYQNQYEMACDFAIDFKAHTGKVITVTGNADSFTVDFFARSYSGSGDSLGYNFLTSAEYGAKWGWMLEIINENRIARGKAALAAGDGQAEARGDCNNFLELSNGRGNTAGYGGDYSNVKFEDYAPKYLKIAAGYIYNDLAAMEKAFLADYGHHSSASEIACATSESSWMLAFISDADKMAKWGFLFDYIYEINGSPADYAKGASYEKFFYMCNINGFFNHKYVKSDFSGGIPSYDYSTVKFTDFADKYLVDPLYGHLGLDALEAEFLKDYGHHSSASEIACATSESSWMLAFISDADKMAKWGWLFDYIFAINGSPADYAKGAAYEKFFYMCNINGFFNQKYVKSDFSGGIPSYDYSQADPADYVDHLPADPDIIREAPTSYSPATGAIIPNPVKENNVFAGWGTLVTSIDTNANSGFWASEDYASNVYLYRKGANEQAAWSDRIGLKLNEDGTYSVSQIATSGASYSYDVDDLTIMISGSYKNYAALHAEFQKIALGQTVCISGSTKTGVATVKFYNIDANPIPAGSEGDKTLNAVFCEVKDENALGYVLDGAKLSADAPDEYSTSMGLTLTMTASKDGYTFKGWSLTKGGAVITEIAKGTRGDIDLYPVFEAIVYNIEYDCNGGSFTKIEIINAYESFDALVADFLADYSAKYGLTGLTAANFNTKSSSYGLLGFWKDAELSAKWAWLKDFILNYSSVYSGLSYLKNDSNASNFNKYWRANIAAFLTQTKLSSPLTMDFAGSVDEDFWTENGLKKDKSVIIEPKLTYTADDLPLELQEPMRDDHTFQGWCDNDYYKREMKTLPAGTLGDIKLYAKWDDTQALVEMKKINYELNGGELGINSPAEFEVDKGINLVDPTKAGYKFLGWSTEKGGTAYITAVPATQMDDITVYANWEVIDYTIEYVLPEGVFFNKETTTKAASQFKSQFKATDKYCIINKVKNMAAIGDSAVYYGTCLLKTEGWKSGTYWNKYGLTEIAPLTFVVGAINNTVGGATFAADYDWVLTAYDSNGNADALKALNLQVGTIVQLDQDPTNLSTTELQNVKCTVVEENPSVIVNKVGNMAAIGDSPVYYGTCLLKTAGWKSGTYWDKYGLKYVADDVLEVCAINNTVGGATFAADYDWVLTAYDSNGNADALKALNLQVGMFLKITGDLEHASQTELVNIKLTVVEEYESCTITKVRNMAAIGDSPVYYGTCLLKTEGWKSGTYWNKYGLTEIGPNIFQVGAMNNTVGGATFAADYDWVLTAYDSNGNADALKALNLQAGDYLYILGDIENAPSDALVSIKCVKIPAENIHTTTVRVDVAHPVKYNVEQLPLALVDPIIELEGKAFFGWFTDDKFVSDKLAAIPAGTTGNLKLYPRIEDEGFVEKNKSKVEYDLDGGVVTAELSPIYYEGDGLTLPTPTKEGYTFLGWLLNDKLTTNYVTAIPATQTGDVKAYAVWYQTPEKPVGPVDNNYYVGADKAYQALDDAIAAAVDAGEEEVTVVLDAGSYTLTSKVSIPVTIVGPNKDVAGYGERAAEAVVVIPQLDITMPSLVFKGITIDSEASNKNIFYPTNTNKELGFYNCIIKDSRESTSYGINTFIRDTNKSDADMVITFDGNDISYVGQFLSWAAKCTDYVFTNNHVLLTGSGAIGSATYNTALYRLRNGNFTFIGNTFTGNLISNPYLFEFSGGGKATVKYNTFDGTTVGIFDNTTPCTKDIEANLCINGATFAADENQAADAAALADAYYTYLNTQHGEILVGETREYKTIDEAIAAAVTAGKEEAVLLLDAGDYTLASTASIAVTIIGPNKDVAGYGERAAEAKITVPQYNITLSSLVFKGVTIDSSASNANIFYPTSANKELAFYNCIIKDSRESTAYGINTYIRDTNKSDVDMKIIFDGNDISYIGQFLTWAAKCTDYVFTNNHVLLTGSGAIGSSTYNTALFRLRSGDFTFMGNTFVGNLISNPFLFEFSGGGKATVKYNTFDATTVAIFDNTTPCTKDIEANLCINGATFAADEKQAADAAALDAAYNEYKAGQVAKPVIISKIAFDLDGGKVDEIVYVYEEGKKVELPTAEKENYVFLGWTLNDGTEYVKEIGKDVTGDVTLHAHFRLDGTTVGEGQDYETIALAVAAAKDNELIIVYPGTYADNFEVKANNVVIIPASTYENVAGDVLVNGAITITGNNVTVQNIKTGETGRFVVNGNYATIKGVEATYAGAKATDYIMYEKAIKGLTIDSCTLVMTGTARVLYGTAALENTTITNNDMTGCASDCGAYSDILRPQTITGFLKINGNKFTGCDQFPLFLGSTANTCGEIEICDNIFKNTGYYSSVIELRSCKAGMYLTFLHNTFEDIHCSKVMNIRGTIKGTYNILGYNKFIDEAGTIVNYITSNGTAEPFVLVDNYFKTAPTSTLVQCTLTGYTNAATAAAADEAYEAYLADQAKLTKSLVDYETFGGTFTLAPRSFYTEGEEFPLATPAKSGYTFLGWSLTSTFDELINALPATTKGDVKVYARFVIYADLTLNLNEGVLENAPTKYITGEDYVLPIPTRTGYKFMGWYDNADFAGEAITKIDAASKDAVALYALWQIEGSFNMKFVLNGGNTLFTSRTEMVDAFMVDYKANVKSGCNLSNFFDSSYGTDADVIAKFLKEHDNGKWAFIYNYLNECLKTASPASSTASDPATATLDNNAALVRGMLNNFLNASNSSGYGIDFSSIELANGFWAILQTEVEGSYTELFTPYQYGHNFIGWYDNAELNGNAVRSLTADGTLYAKFEKIVPTLTYVLNNEEATLTATSVKFQYIDTVTLETPGFNKKYYSFEGWYTDPEFKVAIEKIPAGTFDDITVYGKWTVLEGFTVNYVLNGGQWTEPSKALYDAIVADFRADYTEYSGLPITSWYGETEANYNKLCNVFKMTNHKWDWLLDYWAGVNTCTYSGIGAPSSTVFQALKNGTISFSVQKGYALAVECNAFISSIQTSVYSSALKSAAYNDTLVQNKIWDYYTLGQQTKFVNVHDNVSLPTAYKNNYNFSGWYLNAECTGDPVTTVLEAHTDEDGFVTYYAKWTEGTPVTAVTATNAPTTIDLYKSFQLAWTITPADANFQGVTFASSDPSVLTVSDKGLLFACKPGKATITITSESSSGASTQFEVEVVTPAHWNVSYETESYVAIDGVIGLNAEYVKADGTKGEIVWSTTTDTIVSVDATGKVTGLAEGLGKVVATVKDTDIKFEFTVTVLGAELSDAIKFVVDSHDSNAVQVYDLGIGAGTPAYYLDIIGSVSKILYNEDLTIDTTYKSAQDANSANHGDPMTSVEFITVHYTGNMAKTSDADNNAQYFAGSTTSIHYVTGTYNNNFYCACYVLDEKYGGWHASDSAQGEHEWRASGIMVEESDPDFPTISVADGYLTINGKKTSLALPERKDGIEITGPTFMYNGKERSTINKMGLAWTVIDGQYYLGNYWWGSQEDGNPLCNIGGNRNSIGIESCVDLYSDLYHTWHTTAQLVAQLMVRHNLGIERVVGHHFFSAKDCPQPLLANDLQLWKEFIKMVEAEYEKLTTFKDATFAMTIKSGNEVAAKTGRLVQGNDAACVTYEVEVTLGGKTEKITLATVVNGIYSDPNNVEFSKLSIQKSEGAVLYEGAQHK